MKENTNRKIWQKILVIGIIIVMFIGNMPMTVSQVEAETKNTDAKSVDGTITVFSDDMEGPNYWESTGCWEKGKVSVGPAKSSNSTATDVETRGSLSVSITLPTDSTVSGNVQITVTVGGGITTRKIDWFKIYIGGNCVYTDDTDRFKPQTYYYTWTTKDGNWPDNTYTINAEAQDTGSDTGSATKTVTVDNTPPEISNINPSDWKKTWSQVTAYITDATDVSWAYAWITDKSAPTITEIKSNGKSPSGPGGNGIGTWSVSYGTDGITEGYTYYVWIASGDGLGNFRKESTIVKLDKTPPNNPTGYSSSHTTYVWSNDNTIDISWNGHLDSIGEIYGFSIEWSTSSTTIPDTTTVETTDTSITSGALSSGSSWWFHVKSVDKAGNWATGACHVGPFYIDTTLPNSPSVTESGCGSSWTTHTSPYLTWSNPGDTYSGVSYYQGRIDGGSWNTKSSGWHPTLDTGSHYLDVRAIDCAGNPGLYYSTWVYIDITAPENWQIFTPTDWVNTKTPTCTVQVKDPHSGLKAGSAFYQYSKDGGNSWNGWYSASTTSFNDGYNNFVTLTASNVPFNQESETQNKIQFKINDVLGNIGYSNSYPVKIDSTAPTQGSVTINNDAEFTTSSSITLSLNANDISGIIKMGISNDGNTYTWYNYVASETWSLSSGDGLKKVWVKFRNGAGLDSSSFSDTITLDTSSPTTTIVAPENNSWVTTTTPMLKWKSYDATSKLSGDYHIQISSNSAFTSWVWESYPTGSQTDNAENSVTVPSGKLSEGTYYWRVRAKDKAGLWENFVKYMIIKIDVTAPTVTPICPENNVWTNTTTPTLNFSSYDSLSGLSGVYHIQISTAINFSSAYLVINDSNIAGSTVNDQNTSYKVPAGKLSDGWYYWQVKAKDNAGNWGSFSPYRTLEIDTFVLTTPTNCWATSLNTDYPNNANDTLTSPTIDLTGATSATLTFTHFYRMELIPARTWARDGGIVEITTDDVNWEKITPVEGYPYKIYPGTNLSFRTEVYSGRLDWEQTTFNLTNYTDQRIRFRFRFVSNSAITRRGWYIDDVFVNATFPVDDVGVMAIGIYNPARRDNPYKDTIPLGCPVKIHASIKNYGATNQSAFDVSCIITKPDAITETFTSQLSLSKGDITDLSWQYIPRQWGAYKIKVVTLLPSDIRVENNEQIIENIVTDYFSFLDDVEYSSDVAPFLYSNQSVINSSAWQVVNYTYHNGTQSWWCGNNTTSYYDNNTDASLIVPQMYLPNNLSNSKLSFWTKYHLEGSQWVIVGWPRLLDREFGLPVLLTNSADVNTPGSYILNISATEVYTYDNISFGVASSDTIDNVTWYFGDGEQSYDVVVNHSYTNDGNYTAYCVVDGDGGYAKFPIEITVLNRPPVPVIDAYRLMNVTLRVAGKKENTVTMTLLEDNVSVGQVNVTRQTGDPDEQSKTMVLKVRGNKTYQALLQYDGSNGGANPVKLIFAVDENEDDYEDNECDEDCENEEIEINFNSVDGSYQEQTININSTLKELLEDNTMIIFNASESYDIDGYINSFVWDFGDGTNDTGMIVNHTYAVHGVYNVTLNITDDDCATNETMVPVELSIPTLLINQYPGVGILPSSGVNINWDRLRGDWPRIDWWRPPRIILRHYDNIWVEVSTDNINWNTLSYYPGIGVKNSSNVVVDGWVHMEYDLSGYIGQNVSVRFRMKSDSSITYEGAYIDDILINGTYIGEIPEPPSFNFYAEAYRGSTNITDVYIHLYPLLLEPIPNIVDEVKIKLLDKNNNTITTKTYSNVDVGYGGVIHFHEFMNCTYINVSGKINSEMHERKVNIEDIPDITPTTKIGTTSSETSTTTESTEEPKTASSKAGITETIFFDDMESGKKGWETEGKYWVDWTIYLFGIPVWGHLMEYQENLWHITDYRSSSFSHSWGYNLEKTHSYKLGTRNWGRLSHDVDLTMYNDVTLSFYFFLDREESRGVYDRAIVQVSTNNGKTWKNQMEYMGTWKGWSHVYVDLSAYSGQKIKIGFFFDTVDNKYNNYEGWYIDDVKITGSMAVDVWKNYPAPFSDGKAEKPPGGYGGDAYVNKTSGYGWACAKATHIGYGIQYGFGISTSLIVEIISDASIAALNEASGCTDTKVWVATHVKGDGEQYPINYTSGVGYVWMNTTINTAGALSRNVLWASSSSWVKVSVRVEEYDENWRRVDSYQQPLWTLSSSWNANRVSNVSVGGYVQVNWATGHYYLSKIIIHTHADASGPMSASAGVGVTAYMNSMTWYKPV